MEQTFYTKEIHYFLRGLPWPKGFRYDVVERDTGLFLVVFVENYAEFNPTNQQVIKELIERAIAGVREKGVPCYLEVEIDAPK